MEKHKRSTLESFERYVNSILDNLELMFDKSSGDDLDFLKDTRDHINVYFLENLIENEIESRLFSQFKKIFKSSSIQDGNMSRCTNINEADVVIFSISEHLSQDYVTLLEKLTIPKIGIVTSAVINVSLNRVYNLTLACQLIDHDRLSEINSQITNLFGSKTAKVRRLPFSYLIDTFRNPDVVNPYEIKFHPTLFKLGLLSLMASSLPSRYTHLSIVCDDEIVAKDITNSLRLESTKVSTIKNVVSFRVNLPKGISSKAISSHGVTSFLRLIREVYD